MISLANYRNISNENSPVAPPHVLILKSSSVLGYASNCFSLFNVSIVCQSAGKDTLDRETHRYWKRITSGTQGVR